LNFHHKFRRRDRKAVSGGGVRSNHEHGHIAHDVRRV
jgi:hypothetical protein